MKKMSAKATWEWALADIACGRRSEKCVKAFEGFTNDMFAANKITLDQFITAQTAISAANAAAKQIEKIAA
jgi:hypothetical protein